MVLKNITVLCSNLYYKYLSNKRTATLYFSTPNVVTVMQECTALKRAPQLIRDHAAPATGVRMESIDQILTKMLWLAAMPLVHSLVDTLAQVVYVPRDLTVQRDQNCPRNVQLEPIKTKQELITVKGALKVSLHPDKQKP